MAPVGGHDVRGVAGEVEAPVAHRLGDEAAHAGHALLEHRALRQRPAVEAEPELQLLPDALVGPLADVLVGPALHVEPAQLGRAQAVQREAALVVGVDQLVARGRDGGQDAQPAERVLARVRAQRRLGNGRAADAVEAVAAGDEVALELLRPARRARKRMRGRSPSRSCTLTPSTSNSSGAPLASRAAIRSLTTSVWP